MNLNNFSIRSRLIFVIGFLAVSLVGIGALGLFSLNVTNESLRNVYQNNVVVLGQLERASSLINRNQILVSETVAGQLTDFPEDEEVADERVVLMKQYIAEIDDIWNEYIALELSAEETAIAAQFDEHRKNYGFEGLLPAIAALVAHDFQQTGEILQGPMKESYPSVRASIEALIDLQLEMAKERYEDAGIRYALVRNISLVVVGLGVLLASIIGYWMIRSITAPLNTAVKLAESVAAGDLTQIIDVKCKDETGQLMRAMKAMNGSLSNIVKEVRAGTETIKSASQDIASGNAELSDRTETQAASLEETTSLMQELTTTVTKNAENADHANKLVFSAADVAVKGGDIVGQVVETMASIKGSSSKISDIIGVIDEIAFQTNLLALNAAVEAARAGDQGRGFAVVATEVRNLAQRSAEAAREIKDLIEDSVGKVDQGGKLVDEAGRTMGEIVTSVKGVTDIMSEIATASKQQSAGIQHVNGSISQMDKMTHQNADMVQEASIAADSLQKQAAKLSEAVSIFNIVGAAPISSQRTSASTRRPNTYRSKPAPVKQSVAPARQPKERAKAGVAVKTEEWESF